jgi:hypothetical protein
VQPGDFRHACAACSNALRRFNHRASSTKTDLTADSCNSGQTYGQLPSKPGRTLERPRLDDFNAAIAVAGLRRLLSQYSGLKRMDI